MTDNPPELPTEKNPPAENLNRGDGDRQASPREPMAAPDARDPSRGPPQTDTRQPALTPVDEQIFPAREVHQGLEWAAKEQRDLARDADSEGEARERE